MRRTIAITMTLILVITFIFGVISYADIEGEAESLKEQIISLLTQLGISIMIIMIAWIGFGMLFGGGGDISKYKMRFLFLLLGAILMFKAQSIGDWISGLLN